MVGVQMICLIIAIRAVLPERRDRCHDEARIDFTEAFVIEPALLHRQWRIVFDKDVAAFDEFQKYLAAGGCIGIEGDAELAGVEK